MINTKLTVTTNSSEKFYMSLTKDQIDDLLIKKFIEATQVEIFEDIYVEWRDDGSVCVVAKKLIKDYTVTKEIEI